MGNKFVMNKKITHYVKKGLAKVVIMGKRRPLICQDQLLKTQEAAKKNKLGIWK